MASKCYIYFRLDIAAVRRDTGIGKSVITSLMTLAGAYGMHVSVSERIFVIC